MTNFNYLMDPLAETLADYATTFIGGVEPWESEKWSNWLATQSLIYQGNMQGRHGEFLDWIANSQHSVADYVGDAFADRDSEPLEETLANLFRVSFSKVLDDRAYSLLQVDA